MQLMEWMMKEKVPIEGLFRLFEWRYHMLIKDENHLRRMKITVWPARKAHLFGFAMPLIWQDTQSNTSGFCSDQKIRTFFDCVEIVVGSCLGLCGGIFCLMCKNWSFDTFFQSYSLERLLRCPSARPGPARVKAQSSQLSKWDLRSLRNMQLAAVASLIFKQDISWSFASIPFHRLTNHSIRGSSSPVLCIQPNKCPI